MNNLEIWEKARKVPETAIKPIQAGRLKGKSDINPVWRIKALTEQFGPCGIGWKYIITDKHMEKGANDEIAAFVDINLFVKTDGQWSEPIPGTGGNMFVEKESKGLHTSDECYKMALTDALSVACKALGFAADVYWDKDTTKYTSRGTPQNDLQGDNPSGDPSKWQMSALEKAEMLKLAKEKNIDMKVKGKEWTGKSSSHEWIEADFKKVMEELKK